MKGIRYILNCIISPFEAIAVLIDESKRINEDGTWDSYHAKKNKGAR